MSDKQHHIVTLDVDFNEPALVPAAFDLLRLNARACNLPDVDNIFVHLTLVVEGSAYERNIDELRERLGALWFGDITKVQVLEPRVTEEANDTKEVAA